MTGKHVLITGANGMLGSNLAKLLPYEIVAFSSKELDVTDPQQCEKVVQQQSPSIIIHTAAYTDVEGCQANPNKAFSVNTIGTQNLVNCCIDRDILFVYVSSTGIYGNAKGRGEGSYIEFDTVHPTTAHHSSKYEGEKAVQHHLNKFIIARTGWLFGGSLEHGKNFVYKRYLDAKVANEIFSDDSQIGNPTFIKDLVEQIRVLIETKSYGVYNCVNKATNVSRFDYVSKIVQAFDLDCDVKRAPKTAFKRLAKVSENESATNYKLGLLNLNVMGDWDKALEQYVSELKLDIERTSKL